MWVASVVVSETDLKRRVEVVEHLLKIVLV